MGSQKLLGGRYRFIRSIGADGHYKTYLMADTHYPGHPKCTVKHLKLPARNPMTLKFLSGLLKKKVDMLESLGQHDRIPKILAYFEDHQDFYVVQEYVPGMSLEKVLERSGRIQEPGLLRLLSDILEILEFVQTRGVIHRSIKPSNLICRQSDQRWVLIDFGLVKEVNASMATATNGSGQLAYSRSIYTAPEQHRVPHFGTDIFALGVVALRAATGCDVQNMPHADRADYDQAMQSCLAEAPVLSHELRGVLLRMVDPDPSRRYAKAQDVLSALPLRRMPTPQPKRSEQSQDSGVPKAKKPARRSPWPLWLAVIGLVAVGLGGAIAVRLPERVTAAWWLWRAEQAAATGQTSEAIVTYDRILSLRPDHPQALAQRGQLNLEQGNTEQALQDLTQALEISPQADLYQDRASLRFQVGDLQGAIADYTEALALDPTLVDALVNRGSARAEWGDEQGAIADYSQAIGLDPPIEKLAAAYLNRCLSLSNQGDHAKALADCSEAINLRPDHSLAYENRGLVRRRLGNLEGAIKDYTIAIQINPDSADPYYNRGLTREDLGDLAGALEDFNQALNHDPDHVFARYSRGLLAADQGRRTDALSDLQMAASLCLELGRMSCYEDAQFQINALRNSATGQ